MTVLIICVLYPLPGVWAMRRITWLVYAEERFTRPGVVDGEALCWGLFVGFFAGVLWPLTVVVLVARSAYRRNSVAVLHAVAAAPKEVKRAERIKQLEREAAARERRIASLEREVGVR